MKILKEKEAEDFLEKKGFLIAKRGLAKNYNEVSKIASKLSFPIALKITNTLHKTDDNGVKISNKENLESDFKLLKKKSSSVLVQEYVEGMEIIVGLKKDLTFGHVIIFGLGGVYVEIMKDVSFRICPVELEDIREMMQETKGFQLLKGAKGKKFNIKSIEEVLMKLSKLSQKYPNIEELDINPLIVNNKKAVIVDARIVMR
ncbi:MAG: acetate--CoA ligase family protein [Candidatus Nanoarchaeia archaeon]|jgi:succinyl-CoA synthetase beta subunit|nr:acetate--CoA ligase family protein [Candidatus Nanoarchaeia archaeon]|tara:strand:+ start:19403 stop:20008 length:606 start_codon:yes stop_codon:yes gene_type:complete